MDSAAPQVAAIGALLCLGSPCKGLSEANSVVVRVFLSPETISLAPFPLGRAKPPIHPLRVVWERNRGRFARTNHAVKFVAVYDDGTDSHACHPTTNDSCYYQAFSQAWLLHRPILPLHSLRLKVVERLNVQ
jgi:hypothetical protein